MSNTTWKTLSSGIKTAITFGALAIIGLIIALVVTLSKPELGALYTDLSQSDAAAVVQELKESGINYQLSDNGQTVLIDKAAINDTRLDLSSKNTLSKNDVGLELFKNADYGMTEFAQRVNYQRAMQGELARTIMSLDAVKFARVHLTIAKQGLLISKKEPPKASITLVTNDNLPLSRGQVTGIVSLVAASVKDLNPENVTIINEKGELLNNFGDMNNADMTQSQFEKKQQLEASIKEKISTLLMEIYAMNNFSVSVDASLDFDKKRQVNNKILNAKDKIVASSKIQSASKKVENAKKPETLNSTKNNEIKYLHGSSVEEIEYAVGTIKRISVGVIVPDTFKGIEELSEVIAAAVGLDEARGDKLKLIGLPLTKTLADVKMDFAAMESETDVAAEKATPVSTPAETAKELVANNKAPTEKALPFDLSSSELAYALAGAGLLILTLLGLLLFATKKNKGGKRLSEEQRRVALKEIDQWLKQAQ